MHRYFMNVRSASGELIPDFEGDELPDPEAARSEALATAADLMAHSRGLDWTGCSFEVTDTEGRVVVVLPFADAPKPRRV
jgi:hypothetical protein